MIEPFESPYKTLLSRLQFIMFDFESPYLLYFFEYGNLINGIKKLKMVF
jgi:hypothetical protein